jgi:hypothetical protein
MVVKRASFAFVGSLLLLATAAAAVGNAAPGCGGVGLQAKLQFPTGQSVFAADLTGSGRVDVGTIGVDGVYVWLNLGGGRFAPPIRSSAATQLWVGSPPVVADFDGDGKKDLVVLRALSPQANLVWDLVLFLGDGTGRFREAGTVGPAGLISSLVTGDFDGDGRPDLAFLLGPYPADVVILRNEGAGRFTEWPHVSLSIARSLVAADFDCDGKTDLVVNQCGGAVLLHSYGNGWFAPSTVIPDSPSSCPWVLSALAAADLNGDGVPDLIRTQTYKYIGLSVDVFLGDGRGAFAQPPGATAFINVFPASRLGAEVADLDGDGLPDVVIGVPGAVAVLRGDGKGGLGTPAFLTASPSGALLAADFDGDGLADLLASSGLLLFNTCRADGFERLLNVPVLVSTPGAAGAVWGSDIAITNAGTTAATLDLTYTATVGRGSGTVTTTLPAGAQISDADAFRLLARLGLDTAGPGPHVGTLRTRFRGLSSPHAAGISIRISSAGAGVGLRGVEANPASPQIVDWLKQDAEDRTNLALVNAGGEGDGDIRLRVTLTSTDPLNPGELVLPEATLAPGQFRQFDAVLTASGLKASSAFARVERVAGSAPFLAWAVLNDQTTSDGSVVFSRTNDAWESYMPSFLTTVLETTSYETEVVVTNTTPTPVDASIFYSADALPDTEAPTVSIPASSSWRSASFVDELRRQGVPGIGPRGETIVGTLSVQAVSGGILGFGARVYTRAPAGGRYGVFLWPTPRYGPSGPQVSAWIPDLRQDASFRTNLVLLGGVFRVELFDPSSTRVAVREGVMPGQVNSVLKLWAPGVTRAWARITRTSSTPDEAGVPFTAYAVINDGAEPGLGTGDGSIVWMEPDP